MNNINNAITEDIFEEIKSSAENFKYSSFEYQEFSDCNKSTIFANSSDLIFLLDETTTPQKINFAYNNLDFFIDEIKKIPTDVALQINFACKDHLGVFNELGFSIYAEFCDFFNFNFVETAKNCLDAEINYINDTQYEEVSMISLECANQSRGFTGETTEFFIEWVGDGNNILVEHYNGQLAGFCCVAIYNNGENLWIREIAVAPQFQGNGVAKSLMKQAIKYGFEKGATKGFLAADLQNHNAIKLYNKFGFEQHGTETELQIIRL